MKVHSVFIISRVARYIDLRPQMEAPKWKPDCVVRRNMFVVVENDLEVVCVSAEGLRSGTCLLALNSNMFAPFMRNV